MQHVDRAGGMEHMDIDHLDPRKKKEYLQDIQNLFLTKHACNLRKSDNWPSQEEQKEGLRYLNCCTEADYGVHIFEDPDSHEVWGATPPGRYHVRMCGLNSQNLVSERRERHEKRERVLRGFASLRITTSVDPAIWSVLLTLIRAARDELEKLIPPIPLKRKPPFTASFTV